MDRVTLVRDAVKKLLDGGEALSFDDPQWSAEMLESARQMLVRRLLHREDGP